MATDPVCNSALVRVVEVGGVDEGAVGQSGHRCILAHALGAPDRRDRRCSERSGEGAHDFGLRAVIGPGADGAAERVEDDVLGCGDDGRRQIAEAQVGDEGAEFGGGAGGGGGGG